VKEEFAMSSVYAYSLGQEVPKGTKQESLSPVMVMMELVKDAERHPSCRWNTKKTNRMINALFMAIDCQLIFWPGDFREITRKYGYNQLHEDNPDYPLYGEWPEMFYTRAVAANNISACRSIEKHIDRKPWFFNGRRLCIDKAQPWSHLGAFYHNGEWWNTERIEDSHDCLDARSMENARSLQIDHKKLREIDRAYRLEE
jgi:hypothetical protein